ncbi:MAG TPA: 50S ribosomal protein L25 [Thermoanaerobaculia bacterium]|nr:50S ribosomal protein L25 [Thermoanaerobaculia bacterium]
MSEELQIEVQPRDQTGSGAARRLRREGIVPAVVYGGGRDTVAISVESRVLRDLFREAGSDNAVFLLKLAGGSGKQRHCMVHEIEVDPITRKILHIDFLRIDLSEKVKVMVAIELTGVPAGVRNEGGILDTVLREVEVECLPTVIPRQLEADVTELNIGQHVEAGELVLPKGVELLEDPHRVLASVVAPRLPEEEEEDEDALIEAEMDEPEIVGRREAEDGEGGEEEDEG